MPASVTVFACNANKHREVDLKRKTSSAIVGARITRAEGPLDGQNGEDNFTPSQLSNDMKLVYWPLMGGLLHLVQRTRYWVGPQPAQAPLRCTKM